jgi:hypothetical protein
VWISEVFVPLMLAFKPEQKRRKGLTPPLFCLNLITAVERGC